MARLMHQASFLTCTMRGETALDWRMAAGLLVSACAKYETGNQGGDDEDMCVTDEEDTDPVGQEE